MPTEIDSLQIKIESQSNGAAQSIDALVASLNNLKGAAGVTKVKNSLNTLSIALKNFEANSTGMQKLKELTNALNGLSNVGNLKGLNSSLNALKKIPEITKSLDATTLNAFADACKKVAAALAPLSAQLQIISSAFASMPLKMNQTANAANNYSKAAAAAVPATNKLVQALTGLKAKYTAIVLVAKKVFTAIGGWINQINSYVENVNLFTVAMGKYADEAMEYAETVHNALGIDTSEFIRNQGIFMSMAKGFGLATDAAYEMSKGLTELSYDLASFYNISLDAVGDGAFAKVQSGIAGELEPLRRLGFALSEASLQQVAFNHGIRLSVRDMTDAQKAALRYTAMVEQAGNMGVIGDMARTVTNSANAIRILKQQFAELTRSLGSLFIPILMKIIPYVQAFVDILTEAVQGIADFMGFTMPKIDFSGASNAASDISEGLEEATENAKKLKSQMTGIDELNVISQDTDAESATGNGYGSDLGLDISSIWDESVLKNVKSQVEDIKKKMKPVLETAVLIGGAFATWKIGSALLSGLDLVQTSLFAISNVSAMDDLIMSGSKLAGPLQAIKSVVGKTSIGGLLMGSGSTSVAAAAVAIAAVVAAIAGIAIGLVDVYNKSENFRTGLSTIADGVGFLVGKVGEFFSWIGTGISNLIPEGIKDFIGGLDLSIGDLLITAGGLALFGPWGLLIEGAVLAIKAIGYAASDSLEPVNLFGEGISEATKEKVEPFLLAMDELEQTFLTLDWGNIEITMTDVETIKEQLSAIVTTITDELDADKNEALANIDPLRGAMDAESYEALVSKVEESYAKQAQEVEEGAARINEIMAQAAIEQRDLTDEEAKEIARIQKEMKETGIKYLSESQTESNLILTQLKDNATQLSAEQASEVIKKALEAKNKTIKAADEQYEGILLEAQRMLDTGVINKEEYDKIVKAAEDTRTNTVNEANKQYEDIVDTAKTKMGEYSKYIDTETGEIKSRWTVWCEDLGTWWSDTWSGMKKWASDGWDKVKTWFEESVKPWFTKEKWAEVFSGIKEGLVQGVKNALNRGIEMLNSFIGWINDKVSFDIDSFEIFGKKLWDDMEVTLFTIPKITQRFEDGGFIEDGLFTMNRGEIAGSFNNGKSVVANNEQIIAGISEGVYSAVVAALGDTGGQQSEQSINVYLDGKQIYSSVKKTESERGRQIFGNQLGYGY